MEVVYRVPEPYGPGIIEVYGDKANARYEYRVIVADRVVHDTANACYGVAEVALRDALIWSTRNDS